MLHVLYGQDAFSIARALDKIKAGLGDGEMLATSTIRLEGRNLTLDQLKSNCGALPFLSSHRLVIVDGLLSRFDAKQGRARSVKAKSRGGLGEWEGMGDYIKQMPPTTALILVDGEVKENNPLLKQISPVAEVSPFPLLRGRQLKGWIHQRVKEEGGKIAPTAVDLLAELIGGDLWAMNGEIQKLLLYCLDRTIDEDDVKKLSTHAQEASIFALVDAVAEGRTELAHRTLHRLYNDGVEPIHILVMITRQFRLIALAKDLEHGLSRPQIQDRLGLTGYPLDKTLRQARLYDMEGVKQVYRKLLETDLAIKTGRYGDRLALELLVAELAGA
ncbi:MAG: DNA polymerase III subunit delta [Dehalococcoidia bacterium]